MNRDRLIGHSLWGKGRPIEASTGKAWVRRGHARCECTQLSPMLTGDARRKQWHRDHKDDIRAGGDGVVWMDLKP